MSCGDIRPDSLEYYSYLFDPAPFLRTAGLPKKCRLKDSITFLRVFEYGRIYGLSGNNGVNLYDGALF
jgi:hypothetical protein